LPNLTLKGQAELANKNALLLNSYGTIESIVFSGFTTNLFEASLSTSNDHRALRRQAHTELIMNSLVMDPIPPSDEFLRVELDWDFDAETNVDYLTETTALSNLEPINSNPETFPPYPIECSSDLPFIYNKEIVPLSSYCQAPSDVHSVKTVSDTSSTADSSFSSTSETSIESLDQGLCKEKRPRPVQKARKRAVTTRRSGWKKPKDAPKRYLSAYNIFFAEERRRIHAEQAQSIGFSGLGKMIGQRWTMLTDKQREPYHTMAQKDIGRYREEMKTYEDARRQKIYGRFSSSVTIASTISPSLSDDSRCPSPGRVSSALPNRQSQQCVHHPPTPMVYEPQIIMPDQHYNGQYHIAGGQWQQQQQYGQQPQPQVQYECYRMTRKEAQKYMQQYAGGQHYVQASL
jgi:hypothetical protein